MVIAFSAGIAGRPLYFTQIFFAILITLKASSELYNVLSFEKCPYIRY
jgi:hypothetical protein